MRKKKDKHEDDGEGPPICPDDGPGPDTEPNSVCHPEPEPGQSEGEKRSLPAGRQEAKNEEFKPEEPKKSPKIQYEDDVIEEQIPEKKEIKEEEITPPIILPYEPDSVCHSEQESQSLSTDRQESKNVDSSPPLLLSQKSMEGQDDKAALPQDDTNRQQASFSGRQKELIAYLKEHKQITRKEYADKFNISVPTAARDLKQLLRSGFIIAKGPAAMGRYYVLDDKHSV